MKRKLEETTTNCVITMISQNQEHDISIIMWVEQESELHINDMLKLNHTWSFSHDCQELQSHTLKKHDLSLLSGCPFGFNTMGHFSLSSDHRLWSVYVNISMLSICCSLLQQISDSVDVLHVLQMLLPLAGSRFLVNANAHWDSETHLLRHDQICC